MNRSGCDTYVKASGLASLLMILAFQPVHAAEKKAIGWLEEVQVRDAKLVLKAKIDTGADNSSIKAEIIKKYSKQGEEWIRFKITNKAGQAAILERKVIRYAEIKRKMASPIKRPVVMLGLCLGKVYREVEVNLAKRKKFKYHMLIGRNFLRGYFLVDAEQQYRTSPDCGKMAN